MTVWIYVDTSKQVGDWRALSPSSKLRTKDWICRSTFAAPRRNRPFGEPCETSHPARPLHMAR